MAAPLRAIRAPMAGEVQECRTVAPRRELGQTLPRNDPLGPDEVLHATVPLTMRSDKRKHSFRAVENRTFASHPQTGPGHGYQVVP